MRNDTDFDRAVPGGTREPPFHAMKRNAKPVPSAATLNWACQASHWNVTTCGLARKYGTMGNPELVAGICQMRCQIDTSAVPSVAHCAPVSIWQHAWRRDGIAGGRSESGGRPSNLQRMPAGRLRSRQVSLISGWRFSIRSQPAASPTVDRRGGGQGGRWRRSDARRSGFGPGRSARRLFHRC